MYFDTGLGNAGRPGLDVICLDVNGRPRPCPSCGSNFEWYATEVRENRLVRAWAAPAGEFSSDVDTYVWEDGEWRPVPYMNFHMPQCLWDRRERRLEITREGFVSPDWV